MAALQPPSVFARIVDKLRDKSEEELSILYDALFSENAGRNMIEEVTIQYNKPDKTLSLDKVFGIWKDENISLDSIRQEAWQREK